MYDSITVFCSVSASEMETVKSWLIPSLMLQKGISAIELFLINYTGKNDRLYADDARRGIVSVHEINKGTPCGFGEAHNYAFATVNPSPCFLIVNPDVYMHEYCIHELMSAMAQNGRAAIVEARQLPYEHPKGYDEKTGETPWASGCCILVDSVFFREERGFDELFWMYVEDVDLSWRAWLSGYRVLYHPPAAVYHFTGHYFSYNRYRYYTEYFWSARNFIYIMYKYWGRRGMRRGIQILNRLEYAPGYIREVIASVKEVKRKVDRRSLKGYRRNLKHHRDRILISDFNVYNKISSGEQ